MAGRKPTPTHLKLVTGNPGKRKINRHEPKPLRCIPSCPSHLSDNAKVAWGKLTVLLDRMGVLTEADAAALERMVDCYSDILACRDLINQEGRTYTTTNAQGETLIKAHPAVGMLADADRRFRGYMTDFGMTPSARSRISVTPDEKENKDPSQKYFAS